MVPVVTELMSCVSIASLPSSAECSVDENAAAGAVIVCTLMDMFLLNQFAFDSASSDAVISGA